MFRIRNFKIAVLFVVVLKIYGFELLCISLSEILNIKQVSYLMERFIMAAVIIENIDLY